MKLSVMNPWYVVQKLSPSSASGGGPNAYDIEYYTSAEDGSGMWTEDKHRAMMIESLHSAYRIASSEVAEIRVLVSADDAKEFGRE